MPPNPIKRCIHNKKVIILSRFKPLGRVLTVHAVPFTLFSSARPPISLWLHAVKALNFSGGQSVSAQLSWHVQDMRNGILTIIDPVIIGVSLLILMSNTDTHVTNTDKT